MASAGVVSRSKFPGCLRAIVILGAIGPAAAGGWAKEPSLTAIELYDGASGAAYIQVADVLINGKASIRGCASDSSAIDKSAYGKFSKLTLAAGGVLERGSDGVLRYSSTEGAAAVCVVPENIKFEHNATFTPAVMADSADLRGRAVAAGSDGSAAAPPLKKGVKLVFVAAPDLEKAEYLLAERVGSQAAWQNYLAKYPASPHTDAARKVLASLYLDAGEQALRSYQKTASGAAPAYSDLKNAHTQMGLAHAVLPGTEAESRLAGEIRGCLAALSDKAKTELDAYNTALNSGMPGFLHLENARSLVDAVNSIDPAFVAIRKVEADVSHANDTFAATVRDAEAAAGAKQWDVAIKRIGPYRQFAAEQPRVAKVIDSVYAAYLQQGQQLEDAKDWQDAMVSFQNALKAKDTAEARDGLKAAEKEYTTTQDQAAANAALEKSKVLQLQKDMIPAYEVLVNLPEGQRAIVKDELERIEPDYITGASMRAKEIAAAYPAVKGIGDERAVQNAYGYLQHAYELTGDDVARQDFQTRMQNLGDELSAWFLDRAKHSLEKPLGSGTELGWAYLKEAESYKAANLEAVRDQMKMSDPAHGMHSKISVRAQFRDQTSQRQSGGFASQMESAIAAGLDTSGMSVRIVRSGDTVREGVEPDFLIAGDVLEHHIAAPPTVESIESTFIAGVHEVPSEEWNKANRTYDSATNELRTAQAVLQGVQVKGKKKEIEDANRQVATAQKKVDDARVNLDAIARSKTEDIIRAYTYKKTTYDVVNRVLLQFRIDDVFNNQKGEPVQIEQQDRKKFVTLTDVNAQDSKGVRAEGSLPDLTELQTELENVARENLIKRVQEKIVELPHKIYDMAHQKEQDGYLDDAGEGYMRYLSVAPVDQLSERDHAQKFLKEQFNFQVFPGMIRETPRRLPALEQGMAQPAR